MRLAAAVWRSVSESIFNFAAQGRRQRARAQVRREPPLPLSMERVALHCKRATKAVPVRRAAQEVILQMPLVEGIGKAPHS